MNEVVFVTQNLNKVSDAQKLLSEYWIEHIDFEVPEIQSLDPKEVIKYKLEYAFEKVQKPCFVMDTSLFFDCLNGFPGTLIKWYWEKTVGAEKTCKIAQLFDEYGCQCVTTLGYYDGIQTHFITETLEGRIAEEPRGTHDYHWDVIFIPQGDTRTFAEMTFEEKHTYSVTGKIFDQLVSVLAK